MPVANPDELRYVKSNGLDGTQLQKLSFDEQELVHLAKQVDEAYGPRPANCGTARGDRYWLSQPKKVEIFIANLRRIHRAQLARDPSGKTAANQSPIEVGCSDVISTHIGAHSLKSDLTGSTKLWGFMLSCLKVLKIKIHIVTLAILKVWTPEQINLGEILITVLTGSLVEDGGYNISQAGTKPQLMKTVSYDQEFEEIFGSSSHVKVNLDESEKNMGNYPEVVSSLVKLSSGKAQSELEKYEKEVDKHQEAADEKLHRVQLAKEQVKEDLKELRREQILIEATHAEARANWELHIAMERWLQGEEPGPDGSATVEEEEFLGFGSVDT